MSRDERLLDLRMRLKGFRKNTAGEWVVDTKRDAIPNRNRTRSWRNAEWKKYCFEVLFKSVQSESKTS